MRSQLRPILLVVTFVSIACASVVPRPIEVQAPKRDNSRFDDIERVAATKPTPSAALVASVIPGKPAPLRSQAMTEFDTLEAVAIPGTQVVRRANYFLYMTVVCRVANGHEYSFARAWVTQIDGKTPRQAAQLYLSIGAQDQTTTHESSASDAAAMLDRKLALDEQFEPTTATLTTYGPDDEITFVARRCD